MVDVKLLIVREGLSIREALGLLDRTGEGVLLLVNENDELLRTVTDGDLRRLILKGHALEEPLKCLPVLQSKVIDEGADESTALAIMNRHLVDQLPIVNSRKQPVGIFLRRDIDTRIWLSTPHLGEYEMGFVEEAFRTNWIAPIGPNVDAFEWEFAEHVGIGHAVAVSSGTAALHLALRLLGVREGDTVFCSTFTFVASANPVLYERAIPVFIDSEPATWNMSPIALERALKDATRRGKLPKAVIVVNLYGQSADMDPIIQLCDTYDVPVIEDAAESLGGTYKGRHSGTLGRIGAYSFNGNKIITTSGGGMLVSANGDLMGKARSLSMQARDAAPWYQHSEVGYNYRMSNILAGIGRGQLRVLEERVAARRTVFERYKKGLAHIPALSWMPEAPYGRCTRWLSVCMLDPELARVTPAKFIATLAKSGIEARHVWKPMHLQPLFAECAYYPHDMDISVSDQLFANGLCLPSGSNMSIEQQNRVIQKIESILLG